MTNDGKSRAGGSRSAELSEAWWAQACAVAAHFAGKLSVATFGAVLARTLRARSLGFLVLPFKARLAAVGKAGCLCLGAVHPRRAGSALSTCDVGKSGAAEAADGTAHALRGAAGGAVERVARNAVEVSTTIDARLFIVLSIVKAAIHDGDRGFAVSTVDVLHV